MRVLGSHNAKPGPKGGNSVAVFFDCLATGVPDSRVDHRVDEGRSKHSALGFSIVAHDEWGAEALSRRKQGVEIASPFSSCPAGPSGSPVCLTTTCHRRREIPRLNPAGNVVNQRLRNVPGELGQQGGCPVRTNPLGDLTARIGITPKATDHRYQFQAPKYGCCSRVDRRRPDSVHHQLQRSAGRRGVLDPVGDLGGSDNHRGSGVVTHGQSMPRTCRGPLTRSVEGPGYPPNGAT